MVTPSKETARYQDELTALAENIPFKRIDVPEFDQAEFEPTQVRQERTYVRVDSNMQSIGRFLIERGTVELLPPELSKNLFLEIHWCCHHNLVTRKM